MAIFSDLPQEIVDQVIDCVCSRRDLLSCSLVCHAWLPRSSKSLFSHVTLRRENNVEAFLSVVKTSQRISENVSWLDVQALLSDPSTFITILSSFPNFSSLGFHRVMHLTDTESIPPPEVPYHTISRLQFYYAHGADVLWCLGHFRRIDGLKLTSVHTIPPEPEDTSTMTRHLQLTTLSIRIGNFPMLSHVGRILLPGSFKKLYIPFPERFTPSPIPNLEALDYLQAFLQTVSSSLEHLYLPFCGSKTESTSSEYPSPCFDVLLITHHQSQHYVNALNYHPSTST